MSEADDRRQLQDVMLSYAAAVDVVTADEALNMEEIRILELVRDALDVSDDGAAAIEHAARARHMTVEGAE